MKTVTTARGTQINMSAIAAQHEETRAVSNMPLNARGDIIDNRGKVKVSKEKISATYYKDTVVGVTEQISIKEETANPKTDTANGDPTETSRELRERNDGTLYYEVEYSDGSMTELPYNE
jgi:hypothetical protein